MRAQVTLSAQPGSLTYENLHVFGRGFVYGALGRHVPDLSAVLHGNSGVVPFGFSRPHFVSPERVKGRWGVGGDGVWEVGSPRHDVMWGLVRELADSDVACWGDMTFDVKDVDVRQPPSFDGGTARFRAASPVVVKDSSGTGPFGNPTEGVVAKRRFEEGLRRNAMRKADHLGLSGDVTFDVVDVSGTSFVQKRFGAWVTLDVEGDPELLQMLWSWGVGGSNSSGFGWVS